MNSDLTKVAALLLTGVLPVSAVAEDYRVSHSVEITGAADNIWNRVGDFCDIDDWHPGITSCALKSETGGVHRLITVGDAKVLEKLVASEPGLSYTYSIVSSPFPFERYTATLSITRGTPNTITWSGRFKSEDPDMEQAIMELYKTGLAAIESATTE